jgi:hypothetical protein
MKIFIAGTDARDNDAICRLLNAPKLYSIMDSKKSIRDWDDNHLLMVDSGAHTYNKTTNTKVGYKVRSKVPPVKQYCLDYLKFIELYKDRKYVWVELDIYGHLPIPEIDDMYKRVMDMGIAGKFIRVYHPSMDGGSMENLHKWIEEGQEYIGIGNDSTHMLDEIFSVTKNKVKLHGFAMTKLDLLHRYPFWSADSTTPLSTIIFGKYTRPVMNYYDKDEIIKMKSVWAFQEDPERLHWSILEAMKTQKYFTDLWAERGVIWDELKF